MQRPASPLLDGGGDSMIPSADQERLDAARHELEIARAYRREMRTASEAAELGGAATATLLQEAAKAEARAHAQVLALEQVIAEAKRRGEEARKRLTEGWDDARS